MGTGYWSPCRRLGALVGDDVASPNANAFSQIDHSGKPFRYWRLMYYYSPFWYVKPDFANSLLNRSAVNRSDSDAFQPMLMTRSALTSFSSNPNYVDHSAGLAGHCFRSTANNFFVASSGLVATKHRGAQLNDTSIHLISAACRVPSLNSDLVN